MEEGERDLVVDTLGEEEDDPFEALFNLLEEDFKNDKSSIDDEEISEADLDALADELARALGGGDDVDGIDLFVTATGDVDVDDADDEDDDDSEEDERPTKLKNWQLRRLAYALKAGRRKTSIKNLAAEVCLDRAYVLELLRDPPPKLLMLSATLPDEKPPVAAPENSSSDPIPVESSSAEDVEVEPEEKVKDETVHVMQQRWSAQKRVKKAHIETLEKDLFVETFSSFVETCHFQGCNHVCEPLFHVFGSFFEGSLCKESVRFCYYTVTCLQFFRMSSFVTCILFQRVTCLQRFKESHSFKDSKSQMPSKC